MTKRIVVPQRYGTAFRFASPRTKETPVTDSPATLARPKRADAQRNEQALLDAAAAVFATSGVEAPVREVAAKAGVGVATIYRHFPTRADLVVAVFRHQVIACAEAAPVLLQSEASPHAALVAWSDLFVDFVATKHGLAGALQNDRSGFETLHSYFIDHLMPACGLLLDAAVEAGEIGPGVSAYELMRGIGNLCVGDDNDQNYDARRLVGLLLAGMRLP